MSDHLSQLLALTPRRDNGRDTYNSILMAAERLFVENGIDATTITNIIHISGASTQSLYNFFPDRKNSIVIMLSHLRRRRMKHAIRNAVNHVIIHTNLQKMGEAEGMFLPIYLAVRTIVAASFMVRKEKPVLDDMLLRWMIKHNTTIHTEQESIMVDEIAKAVLAMTNNTISEEKATIAAFLMTHATKGVMEGISLTPDPHPAQEQAEHWLIQAFATMIAQNAHLEHSCAGCFSVQMLGTAYPFIPPEPEEAPVTQTVPTQIPEIPAGMLRLLQNPLNEPLRTYDLPQSSELLHNAGGTPYQLPTHGR